VDKILFKLGRELGKSQKGSRFAYLPCPDCGKKRWVRWIVKQNKPLSPRCLHCAHKLLQQEIRDGIRPKPVITPESHKKISEAKMGRKNPMYGRRGAEMGTWKGGRRESDGYIQIWVDPDDFFYPMAGGQGCVPEHRLVMAKSLNRCLLPWEVVHHKDGTRNNNMLENLELITDKRFHMIDASTKAYIRRLERRIKKLEEQIPGNTDCGRFDGIIFAATQGAIWTRQKVWRCRRQ